MQFTLKEAIEYSKQNRIEEWVQLFLRDKDMEFASPNIVLADGLKLEDRFYYGPVEFELDKITPMRIETNLSGDELDYYNKKVDRMASDFNGENFPPLILEFKDDKYYLTDGSHRYSSLKRLGIDKYYSIIWGNKELEEKNKNILKAYSKRLK